MESFLWLADPGVALFCMCARLPDGIYYRYVLSPFLGSAASRKDRSKENQRSLYLYIRRTDNTVGFRNQYCHIYGWQLSRTAAAGSSSFLYGCEQTFSSRLGSYSVSIWCSILFEHFLQRCYSIFLRCSSQYDEHPFVGNCSTGSVVWIVPDIPNGQFA